MDREEKQEDGREERSNRGGACESPPQETESVSPGQEARFVFMEPLVQGAQGAGGLDPAQSTHG